MKMIEQKGDDSSGKGKAAAAAAAAESLLCTRGNVYTQPSPSTKMAITRRINIV